MSPANEPSATGAQRWLIRGASLLGERTADLLVADGRIERIGEGLEDSDARVIEAQGLIALPGLVDIHTHLREPGREDAETVETGTRAAARGGFTAVFAMANSDPVADTAGVVEQVWGLGRDAGWAQVQPIGAVTVGLAGEQLSEIGAMAESRAAVRVFSDDGKCVHDPLLMRRALEYVKTFDGVVAQHAQDPRLTEGAQMNEGSVSADLGLGGWPAVAEEAIIARDVLLAQHVGSRLHICHLSTKGSVELVRWAKERGIDVTAEVTPHHLLLTDELVRTFDPVYKVNPPLRTEEDVQAVRQAVADGTIDVIGTDHAPHPRQDKECEWSGAAHGMTGLETALSIAQHTLVDTGLLTWADVARVLSETPARIGGLGEQGRPLAEGEPANIVLFDPAAETVVDPEAHASKGRNSPYRGLTLPGSVRATLLRGHPVVLDGELSSPHPDAARSVGGPYQGR
ncbi:MULTISPECIES: dihydroorotase [Kocuria]|uniref:Dihydroorotase n=1 Tax=Kocuria palustris PEL TaxID=1236550 RepID=M2WH84_9MICC|nr:MULTISPECIES: dihydroorotase [Kocuria]EME37932.1 Dihydroorotase [Kocuria palustris PEL]MCT1590975.1 dihydroorotase [Kocuria palustris]